MYFFSGMTSCSFDSWGQGFLTNLGSDKEALLTISSPWHLWYMPVHLTCSPGTSTSPPPLFLASLVLNFFVIDIFAILLIHVIYFNLFLKLPTYLCGIMQWNINQLLLLLLASPLLIVWSLCKACRQANEIFKNILAAGIKTSLLPEISVGIP